MKRLLISAVLLVAAFFAGRAIHRAMAGDETRIRWVLEEEAAAFNGSAVLSVLDDFAPEYRDETAEIGRDGLRAALVWLFQNERDRPTGRFLYRVDLPTEELEVSVEGDRARARFPLQLRKGLGDAAELVWAAWVHADLERREGRWLLVRSRHETLEGRRPGR